MSCNYYNGKCIFLNGKVYEESCIACPIKRAYNKGVIDTKKDYDRPHGKWIPYTTIDGYTKHATCTNCGYERKVGMGCSLNENNLPKYCEACGAKMKEGDKK